MTFSQVLEFEELDGEGNMSSFCVSGAVCVCAFVRNVMSRKDLMITSSQLI